MSADLSRQLAIARIYGWHVYVLSEEGGEYAKIGTAARVRFRVESLQNGNPRRLKVSKCWRVKSRKDAFKLEGYVLGFFDETRVKKRDWIKHSVSVVTAATELAIASLKIEAEEVEPV